MWYDNMIIDCLTCMSCNDYWASQRVVPENDVLHIKIIDLLTCDMGL